MTRLQAVIPPPYEPEPFLLKDRAFEHLTSTGRKLLESVGFPDISQEDIDAARVRIIKELERNLQNDNSELLTLYSAAQDSESSAPASHWERTLDEVLLPERQDVLDEFVVCWDALMWAQHHFGDGWAWSSVEKFRGNLLKAIRKEEKKLGDLVKTATTQKRREAYSGGTSSPIAMGSEEFHESSNLSETVEDCPENAEFLPQAQGTPKRIYSTLPLLTHPAHVDSPDLSDTGLDIRFPSLSAATSLHVPSEDPADDQQLPEASATSPEMTPRSLMRWLQSWPRPGSPGYGWPYPFLHPNPGPSAAKHPKTQRRGDENKPSALPTTNTQGDHIARLASGLQITMPWDFGADGKERLVPSGIAKKKRNVAAILKGPKSVPWMSPYGFCDSESDPEPLRRRTRSVSEDEKFVLEKIL